MRWIPEEGSEWRDCDQWRKRLEACVHAEGGHIETFLWRWLLETLYILPDRLSQFYYPYAILSSLLIDYARHMG